VKSPLILDRVTGEVTSGQQKCYVTVSQWRL